MAVETTTRKTIQTMTALITEFSFTFRALISVPSDIKCIRYNATAGLAEDMTYDTEIPSPSAATDVLKYTVEINEDGVGGTVKVAWPSTNCTITIYRDTSNVQSSDYDDYNQFPADTVENDFDKRTMVTQELQETLDRSLKVPITSTIDGELPAVEGGKYLGWNAAGTAFENKTVDATPSGTTAVLYLSNYASYAAALAAIGSTESVLVLDTAGAVTTDTTTPATLQQVFTKKGVLTVSALMTLTIDGPIDAGAYQIFAGDGTVIINSNKTILVDWWGMNFDGTTDDSGAIQSAIDSVVPSAGGLTLRTVVTFGSKGNIGLSTGILVTDAVQFEGKYSNIYPLANIDMITIQGGGRVKDLNLDFSNLATYEGAGIALTYIHTNYNNGYVKNVYVKGSTPIGAVYTTYGIKCTESVQPRSYFEVDNFRAWCCTYGIYHVPTGTSYINGNTYTNLKLVDCIYPIYEDDTVRVVAGNIFKGSIQPQSVATGMDYCRFESAVVDMVIWDTHYVPVNGLRIYGENGDYKFDMRGVTTLGWFTDIRDYGTYNKIRLNREGKYFDGIGTMEGWTLDWEHENAFLGEARFFDNFIGGPTKWGITTVGTSTLAASTPLTTTDDRVMAVSKLTTGATSMSSIAIFPAGSSAPFRPSERIKALFEVTLNAQVQFLYYVGLWKDASNHIMMSIDQGAAGVDINILTNNGGSLTTTDTGLDSDTTSTRYVIVFDITSTAVKWWLIKDAWTGSAQPLSFMYLTAAAYNSYIAQGTITADIPATSILQPYIYLKTKEDVAKIGYVSTVDVKAQKYKKIY